MVSWFKHVPLRFLGSEKIHRLQPIAKIKTLSAENRKSKRKHEQQQFSVSYWSAQPPQDITSGLPYTAHKALRPTATQPHRSPVNSQQANHNNSPDVPWPLFPGVRAKPKMIGDGFSMMPSRTRLEARSQYILKVDPGAPTLDVSINTSMGGPTTSRDRNVVVYACCSDGSVLPSARLSACVHSFERPVGCNSTLVFVCISLSFTS